LWGIQISGALQALPGYLLGTQALSQGGAGAPSTTANGLGSAYTVTATTKYAVCPGTSAQNGCVVGATIVPGMISSSFSVPLVAPGTELTPRINQTDISFAKRITLERFQINPKLDIFNMFNSSDYFSVRTLTYTTTPGAYKQPGSIIQGRILRLGAVVNW
jgi:hypothetical protein